jgi:GWxTD domain-containing protein
MDKKSALAVALVLLCGPLAVGQNEEPQLAKKYETWIKEEVVYIISPKEKEVFYKLENDRDRDLFIEEFWRQRDPTPGTPRNEFKDEHYRRIAFANLRFGSPSSKQGWKSDRGRIYIKLGPPIDVQRFESANTYPLELWYYRGDPRLGQRGLLRLLFFQKYGAGDYKLYHPVSDGPKSLLPDPTRTPERLGVLKLPPMPDVTWPSSLTGTSKAMPAGWDETDQNAYYLLTEYGTDEVAEATFSLIPGSRDIGGQLLASVNLLGDVEAYPQKKIKDDYALDFLAHKPTVEVSYSTFFINNRCQMAALQSPSGDFFLHYVIVPENLTLENYQTTYFADLKTDIRLTDEHGATVYQGEKYIPVDLKKDEVKAVQGRSFQLYDALPVIPGVHKVNLLLENTVSKEFTTVERTIAVPDARRLGMSPVIMARKVNREGNPSAAAQAFQVGVLQIYPAVNNTFQSKDRMFVFVQIYGISPVLMGEGAIECTVFADGAAVLKTPKRKVADLEGGRDFMEEIDAAALNAGTYTLEAAVLDGSGRQLLSGRTAFLVAETPVPGAWVAAQASPLPDDAQALYVLGTQFLNSGDIDRAREKLEAARSKNAESLDYAVGYARVLLLEKEAGAARDILAPFAGREGGSFDLYQCLGLASQDLGEYRAAVGHYEKALSLKGNVVEVLNSLGECHLALGEREQALRAWQKSLEINPNQERIRNLIEEHRNR